MTEENNGEIVLSFKPSYFISRKIMPFGKASYHIIIHKGEYEKIKNKDDLVNFVFFESDEGKFKGNGGKNDK